MAKKTKAPSLPLDIELQNQIADVRAGRSTALSLATAEFEHLNEVPQEIRQLTNLRTLVLGRGIERLPSWLEELPRLEKIDISHARISAISRVQPNVHWGVNAQQLLIFASQLDPKKISTLTIPNDAAEEATEHALVLGRLGRLELSGFSVLADRIYMHPSRQDLEDKWVCFDIIKSGLDEFLEAQPEIRTLAVFGFPLDTVPRPISQLRKLAILALNGSWLDTIPDWLFDAPALTSLSLFLNRLSVLPDAIGKAQHLNYLGLSHNQFTHIPAGVWKLGALEYLDLYGCPIEEIPADILRLERLAGLRIGGTGAGIADVPAELVSPPPEIAAQGLEAIKRYWSQERDAGIDYLAEAKLLIVGEPGAGKTSLAKKILDPEYELDAAEYSTEGIDVLAWQFPASVRVRDQAGEHLMQRDFRVNIWDFGGQEIYHSTHQFFLTKRSVYVLVTDERKEDADFEYWLEIVNLLSDASPLVIVQNRKQSRQQGVDFGALRQRYANLCGTLVLNLADNSGLEAVVSKIRRELEQLPHIGTPLPKTWRAVRLALEADSRNYISAADFFGICQENGFTDRDDMRQLGGYLHDLGICLFFQEDALLSKTVILKPDWGTTAVYRVLDDPEIASALGLFTKAQLRRVWSDATYEPMRDELLQLMVKFQLCFQVPGSDSYVAPQLLAPSQPVYQWDESDNLALRYEYDVMPKGIVRRVIVALHHQIAPGDLLWRSGAIFEYEGSKAEVIEVYRRRLLTIRIRGGDPRVLLGLIDHELGLIHRSYPGIRFKKFMPCDCATCCASSEPTMFEVGDLKDFAQTGDQIQCRRSRQLRDPVELLRMLSSDVRDHRPAILAMDAPDAVPPAPPAAPIQPEVLVSYSWGGDSEAIVAEIERRMSELGVLITRDKNEVRYRDSIQQFMRRIGAGKCAVVILSKSYLESKYCMYELIQIASRPEFARRVYPIVMPDAAIFDAVARVRYVKYWENKRKELDAEMKQVGQEHLEGIRDELDLYEDIRNTIAGIMTVLADMNTLTPEMHRGSNFDQLYEQLAAALQV